MTESLLSKYSFLPRFIIGRVSFSLPGILSGMTPNNSFEVLINVFVLSLGEHIMMSILNNRMLALSFMLSTGLSNIDSLAALGSL